MLFERGTRFCNEFLAATDDTSLVPDTVDLQICDQLTSHVKILSRRMTVQLLQSDYLVKRGKNQLTAVSQTISISNEKSSPSKVHAI